MTSIESDQTAVVTADQDSDGEPEPFPDPPVIPTLTGLVSVFIDNIDVTGCVQSGSVTKRLNRPRDATVRLFSDCAIGTPCSRLKIYIAGDLWFHGFVTQIATEAGEDGNLMCEYSAQDPMMLWNWRPARDGPFAAGLQGDDFGQPGDFSNPSFFLIGYAPQIMYEILNQSINGATPSEAEGTLFIELGSFAGGITDVSGAPSDFPMTIAEVFELLASTGVLDCIMTPIDSGGNMARLDVYNGDYGTDRTGSVFLDYATGSHNVRALRMSEDSSQVVNKLWYYLGPRKKTAMDPAGNQHWRANITGDDPGLAGPPGGDTNPEGGYNNGPPGNPNNPLGQMILDSREACGVRMEVRIYDGQGEENPLLAPSTYRNLYRRLWQAEAWIRSQPRTLVHVTPVRESEAMMVAPDVTPVGINSFDIGDIITVTAGDIVRGGFTGGQRVYGMTVNFDEDGVLELGEIQTSADQEGLQ